MTIIKVTINPSAPVSVVFSDKGGTGIGEVIVQSILQGSDFTKLVNLSQLVRVGSTMGIVSGGAITATSGLGISVASGVGYLVNPK